MMNSCDITCDIDLDFDEFASYIGSKTLKQGTF